MTADQRIQLLFNRALDLDSAERDAFLKRACGDDEQLLRHLRELLCGDEAAEHSRFWNEPPAEAEALLEFAGEQGRQGETIGVYRVQESIGSGGMGSVYRAVRSDSTFEKCVAIKVLKRGMDTESIVSRFRTERQILASLEHPNIARLIDGGSTADGLPYLVMEYVEGLPIDRYVESHRLPVEERVLLFQQVCAAVEYAHRNMVLHRDLKASNILVTAEGYPKLLDFGIAKLLTPDSTEERTVAPMAFMTPEYASPEQQKGLPMNTSSDVYSLGVLLRRLLDGDRPVDLEYILRKALREEQDLRYATVQELSDDLSRYLEGLPVSARRGSLGYRSHKFLRRYALVITAAVLLFLTMLGGILGTAWQARAARLQKQRAERRFADVRNLATSFLFEAHDALHNVPGTLTARQLIMKRGIEYLNLLQKDVADDRALQAELAVAYDRFGSLTFQVTEALDLHQKALRLNQQIVEAEPANLEYRKQLADSYFEVANMSREMGNTGAALENSRNAVAVLEGLLRNSPGNRFYESAAIGTYEQLARNLSHAGRFAQALSLEEKAFEIAKSLRARIPEGDDSRRELQNAYVFVARGNFDEGQNDRALAASLEAVKMAESVSNPGQNAVYQRDLWVTKLTAAQVMDTCGEHKRALATLQRSLSIIETLFGHDPGDKGYGYGVSFTFGEMARVMESLGRMGEALQSDIKAARIAETLFHGDPNKIETRIHLGNVYIHMGQVQLKMGKLREAAASIEKAMAFLNPLAKADPIHVPVRRALADALKTQGEIGAGLGNPRYAVTRYQASIDIWNSLQARHALRPMDERAREECQRLLDSGLHSAAENPVQPLHKTSRVLYR